MRAARPFAFLPVLALMPLLAQSLPMSVSAAESAPAIRLLLPPPSAAPSEGRYLIDDQVRFMIAVDREQIKLRFIGSDEIFYLTSEPAPLGGRVLKYDTGEVVLQVAGWGGLTLYTDANPGGIPAERADDEVDTFDPPAVAAKDIRSFALKLTQELALAYPFGVGIAADWDGIAQSDTARALSVDAMRNATYAVRMLAEGPDREALSERFHLIRVTAGPEPDARMQDGVLMITYVPNRGASARPSSRAIARVLAEAF
jgi:hypothetical protein